MSIASNNKIEIQKLPERWLGGLGALYGGGAKLPPSRLFLGIRPSDCCPQHPGRREAWKISETWRNHVAWLAGCRQQCPVSNCGTDTKTRRLVAKRPITRPNSSNTLDTFSEKLINKRQTKIWITVTLKILWKWLCIDSDNFDGILPTLDNIDWQTKWTVQTNWSVIWVML